MAKKQQPKLSYGPNTGLIAGEAQVAASEAGLANVGQSFVTGAASVFGAIKQANAERDARMEAYESEIGGLVNTNQFEDPKNKQVIKGFLNTQRDEYIKLSKIYDKTKDREVKDKMEEIKFSLVNLNDQIKVFNQDKLDYRTASDENQLASLKTYDRTGDDFFTTAFTNNAAFSIDEMGDINFGINNNSYKYKDKAGKWESKNNIDESNLLKIYGDSYKEGGKGNAFNSGNVRRGLYNSFKNTGNSALQVFVTTDLTSDESSLSFEEQFASGKLSKEMYAGFTPTGKDKDGVDTYDTDWMFENKNGDILRNKVSDYFTKVVEDGHGQGRADNYKPAPGSGTDGTKTDTNPYGLSLSKKGKYGLGLPSKGTSYVPQYDAAYVTNKIDNLKSGSRIDFQGDNYTFREVDGVTQWWKNYGYGDDYGKKVEGVGIGTPIGTAKDMAEDVFYVGDDPIFNSILTEREQQVPDDITGLMPSDNQFADRQSVAEGQGKAAVVPTDFVDAFKKDFQSDLEVVKYLKNMDVPGLVVGTYQGNPDYNYPNNDNRKLVKASDTAYDDVVLTLNGKTKLFTTDPSFSSDTEGAQEIWNWLYENFSGTQAGVNNDYYNLVDKND